MEPNPLSIIFVKSDSKGDRLLFRYPYAADTKTESSLQNRRKNPYSLTVTEDLLQTPPPQTSNIYKGHLTGFSDEVLSTLFAVKPELCESKFELKVNDVRFVGHPTLLQSGSGGNRNTGNSGPINKENPSIILINIVFALRATASHSIVKCYYDLSKRLGVSLRHEEKRCGYLSKETKKMVTAHDEVAARPEQDVNEDQETPFDIILQRSPLACDLKSVYDALITTGLIHFRINNWIEVSFCLPHKVHQFHKKDFILEPESIYKCLQSIEPYHGLLLLVDATEFLDGLGPDTSPALIRLIKMYSPLKSLHTLAADADLTLTMVFQLTAHLLYWAKAIVIFPLCENNVYVIAPDAPTSIHHPLVDKFSEQFPGLSLLQVMSEFSLPTSISQKLTPVNHPEQQSQLVQMVVWMLQHRLLLQLHTYVYFMPTPNGPSIPRAQPRPIHGQVHNSLRDGSYQSTPEDQRCMSAGAIVPRAPSESDLSSNISDDALISPSPIRTKLNNGMVIPLSSSVVSVDEATFVHNVEQGKPSLVSEALLNGLSSEERAALLKIPAASNPDDLNLVARLIMRGFFRGNHHIEEIMYKENLRRSQLFQLLDKFREVLVTCETEDPVIAMFYSHSYS
uniref:GATOR complex protein NPRL3 n=1 Tax=Timema douglasi TaxID=61478 RepID=A0A7R8VJX7_TIMDO|nr:unnamed protein product [Timema douglasi]